MTKPMKTQQMIDWKLIRIWKRFEKQAAKWKMIHIEVGSPDTFWRFHRKEQWDLGCFPWLAIHAHTPNRSMRVFCIWAGGIEAGNWRRIFSWHKHLDDKHEDES